MNQDSRGNDLLILGLGNPGPEYACTRHNLGAMCVEELGRRLGVALGRKRWRSLVASADVTVPANGEPQATHAWLALPQTYMNESGRAAAAAVRDLGLPASRVWVVYDELDLPLCRLRIRRDGSDAGHNGLRSVIQHLKTRDFPRFRVGVGRPADPRMDPIDYLLSRFPKAEAPMVEEVIAGVASALEEALRSGLERAMETYNRAGSLGCREVPPLAEASS
jgi:PTH1 family peptidyl-tRNA hydrolase